MKISTYQCNYCPSQKGEANHWFLRLPDLEAPGFCLIAWDNETASQDGIEHICGRECAVKALSRWMSPTVANPESLSGPEEL